MPSRPNGSALNQLRTNEIFLSSPWELREFRISAISGQLQQGTVALTPSTSLRQGTALASFINENEGLLMAGTVPSVPLMRSGAPFRGGSSLTDFGMPWTNPGIINQEARHRFALNTCNGCHANETRTSFVHIGPRSAFSEASLSGFMTGISVTDPGGLTHSFNEFARRSVDMSNLLCTASTDGGTASDGGSFPVDGGTRTDGGTVSDGGIRTDSGTASDGGSFPVDGGIRTDGGTASDGGSFPVDGGIRTDGGTASDGGSFPVDGGIRTDGGTVSDGGSVPVDGGIRTDGGTASDGGIRTDGGIRSDAGTF